MANDAIPTGPLNYVATEKLSLKNHSQFDEAWLQNIIAEDPTILGLGDVVVIDRERRQERAGRLDLPLAAPDENLRCEVELQLGATDESHIVRSIEYWDIERRRYPAYEHCAVLIAEDITSRFLNVLQLFAGSIPFIGIQLSALKVRDSIVLD